MQMEWVLAAAVFLCAAILFVVIKRTTQMCARTIFAQPYEPTQEELEASQTPCMLPEEVGELPNGLAAVIGQAAEQAVRCWMQAINDREDKKLTDGAQGLVQPFVETCKTQIASGERERFEQIKVHKSVVSAAVGNTLTVCVSAQAIHYLVCGGQVTGGREDLPEQMLWELVCMDASAAPIQFEQIRQIR